MSKYRFLAAMTAQAVAMGIPVEMQTSEKQDPTTWDLKPRIGSSKYMPHQGARECARRREKRLHMSLRQRLREPQS